MNNNNWKISNFCLHRSTERCSFTDYQYKKKASSNIKKYIKLRCMTSLLGELRDVSIIINESRRWEMELYVRSIDRCHRDASCAVAISILHTYCYTWHRDTGTVKIFVAENRSRRFHLGIFVLARFTVTIHKPKR